VEDGLDLRLSLHFNSCVVACWLVRRMALVVDYLLRIGMLFILG